MDYLELQALGKQQIWGEDFTEILLFPKGRYPKRNTVVTGPPPWRFISQKKRLEVNSVP